MKVNKRRGFAFYSKARRTLAKRYVELISGIFAGASEQIGQSMRAADLF